MANAATIRAALGTAIQTVQWPNDATKTLACGNYFYDQLDPPMVLIAPGNPYREPHQVMNAVNETINFKLFVLVGRTDDESAQILLDGFTASSGAASIQAAVEAAFPVTNVASYAVVRTIDDYGLHTHNDLPYLGCVVNIEVYL